MTNLFFGCGIVKFNEKQLRELKGIYEIPMIRKLGLGDNFSRKLLHAQKTRFRVGLIETNTVVCILAMMFHVCEKRLQGNASKRIYVHDQNIFIDSCLSKEGRKGYSKNEC